VSSKHRLLALLGAGLTALAVSATAMGTASAADVRQVQIRDDCDAATFNAPAPAGVGPGTCVGNGKTTFANFINEVIATHAAKRWVFKPEHAGADAGQKVVATNRGGELHTFTCVKSFGGGVVGGLNAILGLTNTPAVPCDFANVFEAVGPTAVAPGTSSKPVTLGSSGTVMFQCLIHPWMRTTFQIEHS
jgi:plastocyanin